MLRESASQQAGRTGLHVKFCLEHGGLVDGDELESWTY